MEHGRIYSYKREAIYRVIASTKLHPSAEWVYMQLKPQIPDLSIGTVYRNIAAFKSEGQIASVGVVNGQERFDANITPHTHFICDRCGEVFDIESIGYDETAAPKIFEEYGAQVTSYRLIFHGKCKNCISQEAS